MATPVNLLQLSPTMDDGIIVKWLVKEGDDVESGQPIAEVETDKAVMEQESFEDGKVLKIVAKEGTKVPVESLIMVLGEEGEDISDILDSAGGKAGKDTGEKKKKSKPKPTAKIEEVKPDRPEAPGEPANRRDGGRILASPLARKMAEDSGLDLADIDGSGPKGRIVKRDIEEAIEKGVPARKAPAAKKAPAETPREAPAAAAPAPTYSWPQEVEEASLSMMRETVARRLTESKQTVPHFQLILEVRAEKLMEAVDHARAAYPDEKVTVSHFIIKAMANAAMRHKSIRTQWAGDSLKVLPAANISVAVAVEEGLVTPVIRQANGKGVIQIAQELRELAGLARERKLSAEDYSGGCQTISNLGMYGIFEFNAIINPPESSILAIGAMMDKPVVENGQLTVGKVMTVTMSCDHRVVDGAVGAQYLADLKKALEDPMLILM